MDNRCDYEVNDRGVAVLKINNPPMNALDHRTMQDMESTMKNIEKDSSVKVVVITGAGEVFVVGADINEVQQVTTREQGEALTENAQSIFNLVENSRKPVIAAINGMCLGGGVELSLACHIRIAGDKVQMGLPEIMLGLMPAFGGSQRSARVLGTAKALELILTGKFVKMDEAEKIGLVNKVVPHESVLDEAVSMAEGIASKGQLAVRTIVEAVIDGAGLSLKEGLDLESKCLGRLAESEDMKEGLAAFLEKRKPVFKDR